MGPPLSPLQAPLTLPAQTQTRDRPHRKQPASKLPPLSSPSPSPLPQRAGLTAEPHLQTPESEQDELRTFDQKVHLRSTDMVAHMASEFAQMGIPFFCRGALPERPDAELQELRCRMVELLEDLCEG